MEHNTPAVRITSTRDGFWRCGVQHPAAAVIHPAGTFTEEELKRLNADPVLVVDICGDGSPHEAAPADIDLLALKPVELELHLERLADKCPPFDMSFDRANFRKVVLETACESISGAGDANMMTASGKPKTSVLEEFTGYTEVAAAERDAAWEAVQPEA